jgi:hypothetical protein
MVREPMLTRTTVSWIKETVELIVEHGAFNDMVLEVMRTAPQH